MIDNRLSEIMGRRRMGVTDVARAAGISRIAAHRLYHGTTKQVDLGVLDRVCKALGVQVGDILVYVPDEGEKNG